MWSEGQRGAWLGAQVGVSCSHLDKRQWGLEPVWPMVTVKTRGF